MDHFESIEQRKLKITAHTALLPGNARSPAARVGPMILTSNQSFGAWGDIFGDRVIVIVTAILDRVLHHAVTTNIRGNSYRLEDKLESGLMRGRK